MVYVGALALMVVLAVVLSVVPHGPEPAPLGKVLTSAQKEWDVDRPSLATMFPLPESPSQAEWEAVLPVVEKTAADNPEDAGVQRQLALAYYNLGLLDKAQAVYERLLAVKEDAVLRNRLGNVLRDRGDLKGAESNYRRALNLDPEGSDAYMNLAELYWRQHRDGEAVALLEEGLLNVTPESRPVLQRALEIMESGAHPSSTSPPAADPTAGGSGGIMATALSPATSLVGQVSVAEAGTRS